MEIQKFRILRTNPDINWTIPCSGATNLWPLNTSNNCSGTTIYDITFSEIMDFINTNSKFPDKLKDCSITNPGIIVDDTSYTTNLNFCSNIGGHKYIIFKGLNLIYNGSTVSGSYNELSSVIEGFHTMTHTSLLPDVLPCTCVNTLGEDLNKLSIFMSQDYNDIGHYDVWDGNIGQQDTFGNFILSATSSSGYQVTAYRTTDIAYHAGVRDSIFTIDWGDGTITNYGAASYQETHTYTPGLQKQYRVIVTQDTPWGSKSVSNIVTIPHFTYPVMFNQTYSSGTTSGPGSGMTMGHVQLTGLGTQGGIGTSSAYHGIYGSASTTNYFPLDSATDIDQFSGLTFGPTSVFGIPCYTVSGITDSILGNFQTYTTASTINLPPGYQESVLVPIGGDVLNPITNTFETGVYGMILYATPTVTAYTISSSYGASGGYANGDTPINLWDFSNGITIFEAESCGLDKRTFGALECIDCPDDDCMWCQHKDEYIDRTDGIAYEIPGQHPTMGLWDSTMQYNFGEIVYDITWNACCCYINVGGSPATIIGISPSSMMEGVWEDVHMWEACSDECISCPIGTQSPCNDTSLSHAYPDATSIPVGKASYWDVLETYNTGDYVKGGNGNCYESTATSTGIQPTGSTTHWDYVGCVAWECPTDLNASDCVMVSGVTDTSSMSWVDCKADLDANYCFFGKWTCDLPYFQCGGCHEIFPGDPLYTTTSAYTSHLDCIATCSPPAWSCVTPTSQNCCVTYNCLDPQIYIDNVWQAYDQWGGPTTAQTAANLELQDLFFDADDCIDDCCIYESFTWNCEEGCVTQNFVGGYATFGACVWGVNANIDPTTRLNPHFGEINPLTGSLYVTDGTGVYDAVNNNVPCGWTCGTRTEIYNPGNPGPDGVWGTGGDDVDPLGLGQYLSPCDPCYTLNCGDTTIEVDCVTLCSADTACYVCECLNFDNCTLVLDCPTFTDGTQTSYGPNNGVDTGLYLSYTAGIYFTGDYDLLGPLFTYTSSTDCWAACPCGGWDCVVYRAPNASGYGGHNFYDPANPQADVGLGCDTWTELELDDLNYSWSANNPDGTAYTSFHDCCINNPDCCEVACVDCIQHPNSCSVECTAPNVPVGCNPNYPCQYHDGNLSPYPIMYGVGGNVPAMVGCLLNIFTIPGTADLVCDWPTDCSCACLPLLTSWIDNIHFTSTTGLTLTHMGDWDEVYPGSIETYESGSTVYHEQPVAYSQACCYVCACVEDEGMYSMGSLIGTADCNDFEPGTGVNASGQPNCWIDCGSAPSFAGEPCGPCTPSPNDTWECDTSGAGAGCVPSTCSYQSPPMSPAWSTVNNCYLTNNCDYECYHGCGCNTVTTVSECVRLQDALNGLVSADISPIPTNYPYPSYSQCQTILALPTDCCSPIGVSYDCVADSDCESDPNSVINGPGQGCVEIYPPTIGMFNDTNLTQIVPGVGSVTFATPLDACKAFCTWSCENNNGCGFDAWYNYPAGTFNTAYDCWFNSGQDCTSCDETFFCFSGMPGTNQIVPASFLASLGPPNTGHLAHAESLGPGGVTYNVNQYGFLDEITCQTFCRFKCNSDPSSCVCELAWGDISGGDISMTECVGQQEPCCYAEWWCMPSEGCKGYTNNQLVTDGGTSNGESPDGAPVGHKAGPYYQIGGVPATDTTGNPGTGEAGCLQYCGYVCGDGWELYLGECGCAWVHNEWDLGMYNLSFASVGAGIAIAGDPGTYNTEAQCNIDSIATTIGDIGCCDCYNCIQQTLNLGGTPFPTMDTSNIVGNVMTWTGNGQATVASDPVSFNGTTAQPWAQVGVTYNQGDIVIFLSGTTDCCYVYNGCCDTSNGNPCTGQGNLICGQFTPNNSTVNPWQQWTDYQNMLLTVGTGTDCSFFNTGNVVIYMPQFRGLQAVNVNNLGIAAQCGILTTDIWTQGPDWIPCNQGCPAP